YLVFFVSCYAYDDDLHSFPTRRSSDLLMNAADAFVLSSSVEGLPTVLLEAAASGLTAVATDVGGVGEAVIHGRTGYVESPLRRLDRKSTRLNSSHVAISYAVLCLKNKK